MNAPTIARDDNDFVAEIVIRDPYGQDFELQRNLTRAVLAMLKRSLGGSTDDDDRRFIRAAESDLDRIASWQPTEASAERSRQALSVLISASETLGTDGLLLEDVKDRMRSIASRLRDYQSLDKDQLTGTVEDLRRVRDALLQERPVPTDTARDTGVRAI